MAAMHRNRAFRDGSMIEERLRGDCGQCAVSAHAAAPSQTQATRRSNTNAHTGEATGPATHQNMVRATATWQLSNQHDQPLGMAATDHLVSRVNKVSMMKQGDRASVGRRFNHQRWLVKQSC